MQKEETKTRIEEKKKLNLGSMDKRELGVVTGGKGELGGSL